MYYSTRAILLSKNLTPKTHSGLLSVFGEYFIKPGILPKKLVKYLRKGFEARLLGDYNVSVDIQKENAHDLINNAKKFNDAILDYLRNNSII